MSERKPDEDYGNKLSQQINEYIKKIRYGSITLVIQDGKVIQIESHEKVRLQ